MEEIKKILDEKLKNNEPLLVNTIISYLEFCDVCEVLNRIYFRHYSSKKKCCYKCYDIWINYHAL